MKMKLRGYMVKRKGVYISGNLTFNLICSAKTFEESLNGINQLTKDYVEEASSKLSGEVKNLKFLKRPAPLFMYRDFIFYMTSYYRSKIFMAIKKFFRVKDNTNNNK